MNGTEHWIQFKPKPSWQNVSSFGLGGGGEALSLMLGVGRGVLAELITKNKPANEGQHGPTQRADWVGENGRRNNRIEDRSKGQSMAKR